MDRDGGLEAWHTPEGVKHRKGKTYLGRVGVRRQREWEKLSPDIRGGIVEDWIRGKRAEKGINT